MDKMERLAGGAVVVAIIGVLLAGMLRTPRHAEVATAPTAATAATASIDHLKLPDGTLGLGPIVAYLEAAQAFTPADQFSKPFDDSALIGLKFELLIFERNQPYDQWPINFSYDAGREELSLRVSTDTDYKDNQGGALIYVPIEQKSVYLDKRSGQNAFGVKAEYTPVIETIFGIGNFDHEYNVFAHLLGRKGDDPGEELAKVIGLSPDRARQAAADMRLELEGVITAGKNGRAIACSAYQTDAKLNYPYEVDLKICVVSVRLNEARIISRSAGILAEWPSLQ